jgi:hypothetical protein
MDVIKQNTIQTKAMPKICVSDMFWKMAGIQE